MHYIYELGPIDHGWSMALNPNTYYGTLALQASNQALHDICTNEGSLEMRIFEDEYQEKLKILRAVSSWEGDIINQGILALPSDEPYMDWGLILKQRNNGSTYVCSPQPYIFLADEYFFPLPEEELTRRQVKLGIDYIVEQDEDLKCLKVRKIHN